MTLEGLMVKGYGLTPPRGNRRTGDRAALSAASASAIVAPGGRSMKALAPPLSLRARAPVHATAAPGAKSIPAAPELEPATFVIDPPGGAEIQELP